MTGNGEHLDTRLMSPYRAEPFHVVPARTLALLREHSELGERFVLLGLGCREGKGKNGDLSPWSAHDLLTNRQYLIQRRPDSDEYLDSSSMNGIYYLLCSVVERTGCLLRVKPPFDDAAELCMDHGSRRHRRMEPYQAVPKPDQSSESQLF